MKRGDVNWEEFAKALLWHLVVCNKNEDSGYDVTLDSNREISCWRLVSACPPLHKALTWKELALELGLFEDLLVYDGHDCKKCEHEKKCHAYFKYDMDHERCNQWIEDHKTNDHEENNV